MLNFIKNFRNDEDGAVTVDWVVLTAAIVALGLLVGTTVRNAAIAKTDLIVADIQKVAGSK
ncbi:Flp family type IVb pilin [Loktanella salsilacus]|uniref:Flp family type IVb pilin n=1 Tax=Loktanella salsilacus TaxID=195913 RepID=UPI003704434C